MSSRPPYRRPDRDPEDAGSREYSSRRFAGRPGDRDYGDDRYQSSRSYRRDDDYADDRGYGAAPGGSGSGSGPRQPEVIYRRRRAAALIAVLVVVAILVLIMAKFAGGGKKDDPNPAAATETATTTLSSSATTAHSTEASTSAEASQTSSPDPKASEDPSATTTSAQPKKKTCELKDLRIEVSSDKPNYGPNDEPVFYMTVKNPTAADCTIDLDKDILRFEVYDLASNERVWADVDCNSSEGTGTRTFPADSQRHFEARWSRTGSTPDRCDNRAPVKPGGYFLHGVIGTNPSDAYTFNLG